MFVKAAVFPLAQQVGGHLMDALVEAFDGDATGLVVEGGDEARDFAQRVEGRAAIMARVQVDARAGYGELILEHAAQLRGDGGHAGGHHGGIADQGQVGGKFGSVVAHEGDERGRA